jgi:hypothetical protein
MIFQHTWEDVLSGKKTQTRRLWVDTDHTWIGGYREGDQYPNGSRSTYTEICRKDGVVRYAVGKTYAVQQGRSKPAIARIKVVGLWRERVQEISAQDAIRELAYQHVYDDAQGYIWSFRVLWDQVHKVKGTRWEDNPIVTCIEFELVQD